MDRTIIHSDLNCFFASVEMMLDHSLRGKPMAVCGSTEERHGIILAKSWEAKQMGVKTGMARWQAERLCPGIILVPPRYNEYIKYSKLVRSIYDRYTDQVEPYGIDECWLDVTGSRYLFGSGIEIATKIKESIKKELDLTVSMGVSFNKIFAKFGSDVNTPDNIRIIGRDNFREEIWNNPVSDLIFVGRATTKKLNGYGIRTVGNLAKASPLFLKKILGKNGLVLWKYANGLDTSPVNSCEYVYPAKSISHGTTMTSDITDIEDIRRIILFLSQTIGRHLHQLGLGASSVKIDIRDKDLNWCSFQTSLSFYTQSYLHISNACLDLFMEKYRFTSGIRSISIGVFKLKGTDEPFQLSLFPEDKREEKLIQLDKTVFEIRKRFGKDSIKPLALLDNTKLPSAITSGLPHPISR